MESLVLSVKGLYTNFNELSAVPQGALSVANNIVVAKDGIAESRRGFDRLAFTLPLTTDRAIKLLQYQNTLMVHYRGTQLGRYSSSTGVSAYTGSYSSPDSNLALIKYAEANQNLYFTSSKGIQKLDVVTGTPYQAGMFKGLDCQATASANASGFMTDESQVAYRVVWGKTDANSNLVLGAPSQRAVIANTSGGNQDVSLSTTIPAGVTVNHFFQLYRGNQASALYSSASGTIQDVTFTAADAYTGTSGNNISVQYTVGAVHGAEVVSIHYSALTVGALTFTSVLGGGLGKQVTIAYTSGGTAGSEVVTVTGKAISVKIQSGVSSDNQIKAALNASSSALALISVSGAGAGAETTMTATALTSGYVGVQIATGVSTAADIVAALNSYAPALAILSPAVSGVSTNTQTAAASVSLSGGSVTLVTPDDNVQLVYEGSTPGSTLVAQDITFTSVPAGLLGNSVRVRYIVGGSAGAEVVTVLQSSLVVQDLTYTSVAYGGLGDLASVIYTSGATAGSEVVTVVGNAVTVQISSGISTADQILAAINASAAALNVLSVAVSGTGTNTQTTAVQAFLSGGQVKVQIASGVSTATQILAAINASTAAASLLTAVISGSGSNTQTAFASTALSGGIATITIVDSVPDSLRGAALYTNATQEGILQSNELPPYASDLAVFKNCLFFGNTKSKQILEFSILSVGGSAGVQNGDTITVAGTTYTGASSESIGSLQFAVVTSGSAAQNINDTALSLVRVINQNTTNTSVYAYYVSTPTGLPGKIQIEERILGGATYYIIASAHGSAYSPALPTSGTRVASSNQVALNGLMYSKQQQPDAVPSVNILYVGSASKKVLRILALRDSLFILKEDGIFRCTGSDPTTFTISLVDNTAILLAPESAATLSNQIYALTTQGVVAISDTGVEVMSRPIEDKLVSLFGNALTPLQYYSFGVGYESEREYILWTVSASSDTYATQAFVYNIFTKAWTRWTRSQGPGLILAGDNKLYVTDPTTNYINQERKNEDYTDFMDESLSVTFVSASQYNVTVVDATGAAVGDLLYQSNAISSLITAVDSINSIITVTDLLTWDALAPTFVNKSIDCLIEWVPNPANGQPGYLKQWSEAILQFKQSGYSNAYVNFYSEISTSLDSVPLTGIATGTWGKFAWGSIPWGGISQRRLVRTYVPLEKQRCGILSVQFKCQEAFSNFAVEGVALNFRYISSRTGT